MSWEIKQGDAREVLAGLPAGSVQCCVTSPPYWGLRCYGGLEMQTAWGDLAAFARPRRHRERWWLRIRHRAAERGSGVLSPDKKCWIGSLGREPTPEMFVAHLVEVIRAVRRVLRDDGTLWLNLGDTYSSGDRGTYRSGASDNKGHQVQDDQPRPRTPPGLKPKDLVGIPWMVAFALRDDGWYLRSPIIWSKPNPMTESVTDRPTTSHEYLFLLTMKPRYYYDQDAVRGLYAPDSVDRVARGRSDNHKWADGGPGDQSLAKDLSQACSSPLGPNRRTVWTISTQSFPGPHFATFPFKLVEPCIKAGTSLKGCCPKCGAGWVRVVEKERKPTRPARDNVNDPTGMANRDPERHVTESVTTGWRRGCKCEAGEPVPCTVLDPFAGAGTAIVEALRQGRSAIGIELNAEYAAMARKRIEEDAPLFNASMEVP